VKRSEWWGGAQWRGLSPEDESHFSILFPKRKILTFTKLLLLYSLLWMILSGGAIDLLKSFLDILGWHEASPPLNLLVFP